ncbi:LysR family transcriptional regulator [Trinickia caryophylli]|uniref:DNA-binding transcriptional regulator, LysR family n=1 Tax=Trinickia caryophylli TaxID=28094 RepID=A0A1X7CNS3_TRICW|nr:LysR family transcriptional regulator [Trinickia caryophylli]PMS11277.1 LysR family transcriptional regulator [Trinickia caryophylli]TRX20130.1 LysR family transcriptional regulator [Trinickia caryophylli]WQE12519.1 LysR family transcriptional regulator [Trinickia caryophylli]SMF00095.1 DNA-binding transcriptional regulator, LysR family [Trinickia caryophylli]GLU30203.1 LysR family transcriptional regulator [Trinickia caryophylli]
MDLKRLRYFCAVIEQGTIAKAARVLNISQPPLSKRLQELEEEIGAPLFSRGTKKVEPTAAGHHLYRRACEILRGVEDATRETISLARTETRTLRIGLTHLYQNYFQNFMLELNKRNPGIQIGVSISDSSHLERLLQNKLIDIALIQHPEHVDGYSCIDLEPVRLVAVVGRALSGVAPRGAATLAEVGHWPLVLLRRAEGLGTFDRLQHKLREVGIRPNVVHYISQPGVILNLIESGLPAAALLPASEVDPGRWPQCEVIEIEPRVDVFYPSIVKLTAAPHVPEVMDIVDEGYRFSEKEFRC